MSKPLKLLTLKAAAPQFDASKGVDGLPQRILVMPWGDNTTSEGQVIVNATTLNQLASYNAGKNWDRPALDFEHNSVPGSPTYQGEPVKVAGYGTLQVVENEGIYLLMSSWTKEGQDYASGGHYGDLSPVVQVNAKNEVIGLHSAALCRHGATPGLLFLSATTTPTQSMDKPQTADDLLAALKTLLGLGADSLPADVLTALNAKMKAGDAPSADDATKALTAALAPLVQKIEEQGAQLKLLSATHETSERGTILASAAREGKVVPKMAANLPIDQLKALCAELPVTVPMEQRTGDLTTLMLTSGGGSTPEAEAVSKLTGVSAEQRAKHKDR